jgi:hypothetical protein
MRMSVSTVSWLLPLVCLRYGVAMPSVWPRRRACKQRQFSDFHSDSPLNFTLYWFRVGNVGEISAGACWLRCNRRPLAFRYVPCSLGRLRIALPFLALSFAVFWCCAGSLVRISLRCGTRFRQAFTIQFAPRVVLFRRVWQPTTTPTTLEAISLD